MKIIVTIFTYLFFVKGIYKKKKNANENGYFLAFFLLFLNLHSVFVLFDVYSEMIDIVSLWKTGKENKGGFGYIIGAIMSIFIIILINKFKKHTKFVDRVSIYRKSIKTVKRKYSIFYVIFSVVLFFTSLFILAKHLFH